MEDTAGKIWQNEDWLRQKYLVEGLTLAQMGQLVGKSLCTIHNWMIKYGIPRRTLSEVWTPERRNDFAERMSSPERRKKSRDGMTRYRRSKRGRQESSEKMKEIWQREEYREAHCGENNPAWAGDRVEVVCEVCGEVEYLRPKVAEGKRFCSYTCMGIGLGREMLGPKHPRWKERIEKTCENCGKVFETPSGSQERRFCSKPCKYEYMVGPNAPIWFGGPPSEYSPEFNESLKLFIKDRDKYICTVCKMAGSVVHHIDYDKKNSSPNNLITLCPSCHSATNHHRDYWENELGQLINIHRVERQYASI